MRDGRPVEAASSVRAVQIATALAIIGVLAITAPAEPPG